MLLLGPGGKTGAGGSLSGVGPRPGALQPGGPVLTVSQAPRAAAPAKHSASVPASSPAVSWYGRLVWEGAVQAGQAPHPALRPGPASQGHVAPRATVPPARCPLGCCHDPLGFIFLVKGKLSVS